MANAGEHATNTKQLPTFTSLKAHERLAIELREEGHSHQSIVNQINTDFDLTYKQGTIREWFMAGGRLEQAYLEYAEFLADESVKRAKLKIKRLSGVAADKLEDLMNDPQTADNIVERAARTVLNKYIPDKQIIIDETSSNGIPDELSKQGDDLMNGDPDGPQSVDNPPESKDAGGQDGGKRSETLSEEILPESPTADKPGS